MPRGRPRNTPAPETPREEELLEQAAVPAQDYENAATGQAAESQEPDSVEMREEPSAEEQEAAAMYGPSAESQEPVSDGMQEQDAAPAETPEQAAQESQEEPAAEQEQAEPSDTLPGYIAENLRDDFLAFMRNFGIGGDRSEEVCAAVMTLAEQVSAGQTAAEGYTEQDQNESPLEPPIPLSVRITSLEMDGGTRAFAVAEYGDLTVSRIRVKEDDYGTLSVSMPKFRQTGGGWKETCRFNTVEARNRLTGAVLDAYEQQMAQLQGQEQGDSPEQEEQEQDGPVMGMSQY
jgi:DNA-binding cell septation regulator SpoVG